MLILGLTGSLAMGKSTIAEMLRARGLPVFDADAEVHALYRGEAVPLIEAAFPGTTSQDGVDRPLLAKALGRNADAFRRLEAIVHPLVKKAEKAFLDREHARGTKIAVLEIPLLLETGLDAKVDQVLIVSASEDQQRARALARPGMTADRFEALRARQMPDAEKRRRAHVVIDTSGTLAQSEAAVDAALRGLSSVKATAYDRHWA